VHNCGEYSIVNAISLLHILLAWLTYSSQIYPSTGPETAGRVQISTVTFEERAVSFEEIYQEEESDIKGAIAASNVASIGGWMASALGRKTLSNDSVNVAIENKEAVLLKRQQAAAITVQGAWKMKQARRRRAEIQQKKLEHKQQVAVTRVQNMWRGLRARRVVKNLLKQQRAAKIITRAVKTSYFIIKYLRQLSDNQPHVVLVELESAQGVTVPSNGPAESMFVVLSAYDSPRKDDQLKGGNASPFPIVRKMSTC
jgi:hypothetical protein